MNIIPKKKLWFFHLNSILVIFYVLHIKLTIFTLVKCSYGWVIVYTKFRGVLEILVPQQRVGNLSCIWNLSPNKPIPLGPGITVLRKLGPGRTKQPSALLKLTALELRVLLVWRRNRQSELKNYARKERMQDHKVIFLMACLYSVYGHTVADVAT